MKETSGILILFAGCNIVVKTVLTAISVYVRGIGK
jgi:hypothetical protein